MIRSIPPAGVYGALIAALAAATWPVWRWWLFAFNPTLDQLLQIRCF